MAEQRAIYAAYLNGTGNLAAQPGYSNLRQEPGCGLTAPG
jgi:hypothetical protein